MSVRAYTLGDRWRTGGLVIGWLVGVWPAIAIEASPALPITEDEITGYMGSLFNALKTCNAAWFNDQLLESAEIQVISSSGQVLAMTPAEYVKDMQEDCVPYQYVRWTQTSWHVLREGHRATVRWQLGWVEEPARGVRQAVQLVFHQQTSLIREDWRIRIEAIKVRSEELAPGAEARFWERVKGRILFSTMR